MLMWELDNARNCTEGHAEHCNRLYVDVCVEQCKKWFVDVHVEQRQELHVDVCVD